MQTNKNTESTCAITLQERDNLIIKYIPLAEKLAYRKDKATPSNISFDDLKSIAFFALVAAASKFNGNYQTFAGYVRTRINGEMIDYIRNSCWGTRGNYSAIISLDQTLNKDGFTLAETIEDYRKPNTLQRNKHVA